MNACKAVCMLWTLWKFKEPTLVTVGDAVSSFLDDPDDLTKDRCLMDKNNLSKGPLRWSINQSAPNAEPSPQKVQVLQRRHWFAAASAKRWLLTVGLCVVVIVTGTGLLAYASWITSIYANGQSILSGGKFNLRL